ncbi:hypothetical protein NFI96_023212, partial [Prochilodus magdalenae]
GALRPSLEKARSRREGLKEREEREEQKRAGAREREVHGKMRSGWIFVLLACVWSPALGTYQQVQWSCEEVQWSLKEVQWSLKEVQRSGEDVQWSGEEVQWSLMEVQWSLMEVQWSCEEVQWCCEKVQQSCEEVQWFREEVQWSREEVQWSHEEVQWSLMEVQWSLMEVQCSGVEVQWSLMKVQRSREEAQRSREEVQWSREEVQWSREEVQWSLMEVQWSLMEVQCSGVEVQWSLMEVQWSLMKVQRFREEVQWSREEVQWFCEEVQCTAAGSDQPGNAGSDQPGNARTAILEYRCRNVVILDSGKCLCNGKAQYCVQDSLGLRCENCQGNTEGRHCENCKEGFYHQRAGENCQPCYCNPAGSVGEECSSRGQCVCKPGAQGSRCDRCANGAPVTAQGCGSQRLDTCFCNGHSSECSPARGYSVYNITTTFDQGMEGWQPVTAPTVNRAQVISRWSPAYHNIEVISKDLMPVYLSAPGQYLGNQVLSYGQTLSFSLRLDRGVRHPSTSDVVLEGAGRMVSASLGSLRNVIPCGKKITYAFSPSPVGTVRCPTGHCPTGRCPTGRCPTGRSPTGHCPTGRCPQDAAPQDTAPQDAAPQDAAHRTLPHRTLPHRTLPHRTLPHRTLPTGRCPTGHCPTGRCPTGRCPQDAVSQDAPPQDAAPQDTAPQDAAPQDAAPQDAAPQDAAPQDAVGWIVLCHCSAENDPPPTSYLLCGGPVGVLTRAYSQRLDEQPASRWKPQLSSTEFQTLLSDLTAIKIRGTFGENGRGYLDDVVLVSARPGSGTPAAWVKKCRCPAGYDGEFCEYCATGYKRRYPGRGRRSPCEPCSCRGGSCDPETGDCYSADETGPPCPAGFYDNPRQPGTCLRCPCPQGQTCLVPPGTLDVICNCPPGTRGSRCQKCDDGFFGDPQGERGFPQPCRPCQCNGHTDLNSLSNCDDVTGECLKCMNNTRGWSCEDCVEGFYHRRPTDACQACNCNLQGALSRSCSDQGQCRCREGFEGLRCDRSACPSCFNPIKNQMEKYVRKLQELEALFNGMGSGGAFNSSALEKALSTAEETLSLVLTELSPVLTELSPVLTELSPVLTELSLVLTELSPVLTELSPVLTELSLVLTELSPVLTELSLVLTELSPVLTELSLVLTELSPVLTELSPVLTELSPVLTELSLVLTELSPVLTELSLVLTELSPVLTELSLLSLVLTELSPVLTEPSLVLTELSLVLTELSLVLTELSPVLTELSLVLTELSPVLTELSPVLTELSLVLTELSLVLTELSLVLTELSPVLTELSLVLTELSLVLTELSLVLTELSLVLTELSLVLTELSPVLTELSPRTDRAVPCTDRAVPRTDRAVPRTDRAVPRTDRAVPCTDRAVPCTDRAVPRTDRAVPRTDRAVPRTDRAVPRTDRAVPVLTELSPVLTELSPVLTELSPVLTELSPVLTELSPVLTELSPVLTELSLVLTELSLVLTELSPVLTELSLVLTELSPVLTELSPVLTELSLVLTELSPVLTELSLVLTELSLVLTELSPVLTELSLLSPVLTELSLVLTELSPVLTELSPVLTELSLVLTELSPVLTELSPVLTELSPVLTELSLVLTELSPVLTELSPVLTELSPVLTELSPVLTELSLVLTELSPVLTELSPVLTELSPVLTELSPVLTELSPVLTELSLVLTVPRTDRAVPCTDGAVPRTDRAVPCTDRAVPRTDRAVPCTDRAVPCTDRAVPRTDRAVPRTDRAVPCTDRAVPRTDRAVPHTEELLYNRLLSLSTTHSKQERRLQDIFNTMNSTGWDWQFSKDVADIWKLISTIRQNLIQAKSDLNRIELPQRDAEPVNNTMTSLVQKATDLAQRHQNESGSVEQTANHALSTSENASALVNPILKEERSLANTISFYKTQFEKDAALVKALEEQAPVVNGAAVAESKVALDTLKLISELGKNLTAAPQEDVAGLVGRLNQLKDSIQSNATSYEDLQKDVLANRNETAHLLEQAKAAQQAQEKLLSRANAAKAKADQAVKLFDSLGSVDEDLDKLRAHLHNWPVNMLGDPRVLWDKRCQDDDRVPPSRFTCRPTKRAHAACNDLATLRDEVSVLGDTVGGVSSGFGGRISSGKAAADEALRKLPLINSTIQQAMANNAKTQDVLGSLGDYREAQDTLDKLDNTLSRIEKMSTSGPSSSDLLATATLLKTGMEGLSTEAGLTMNQLTREKQDAEKTRKLAEKVGHVTITMQLHPGGAAPTQTLCFSPQVNQDANEVYKGARDTRTAVADTLATVNNLIKLLGNPAAVDDKKVAELERAVANSRSLVDNELRPKLTQLEDKEAQQRATIQQMISDIGTILLDIKNLEHINQTIPDGCYNIQPKERP